MLTAAFENRINKVRIVGEVDDALAFRLRLQSLLSSADFSIPGVSPSSIVCIRSVPDPRPQTLRLVRGELEGAGVWSEALNRSLAGTVSRAARPTNGFVPANAECVLFADKAEMLACVARDWLSGSLWTRWWWKILLPSGDSAEIIKQLWRDHPQYVPAAVDQLERESLAADFINELPDDECRELLQQTVRAFAIQELDPVCQSALRIDYANLNETSISLPSSAVIELRSFEQKSASAPWEPWCHKSSAAVLSPERQRFLGIVLTIARAPSHARRPEFARAVERWQEELISRHANLLTGIPLEERALDSRLASPGVIESVESIADHPLTPSQQPTAVDAPENADRPSTGDFKSRTSAEPPRAKPSFRDANDSSAERRLQTVAVADESVEPTTESAPEFVREIPIAPAEPAAAERPSEQLATLDVVTEAPWLEIETQLGGLFYLINLALYLNLYGDLTMPAAPEIELNIWDFVSLVGAELIGDEDAQDPIWEWLAEMSGREDDERAGDDREPLDRRPRPPEWLSLLMPSLRARLRVALGSQSDDDAARTLCRHYARVRATETHVDVFFVLADLPLEIRFAGLDRDPGWVPAAGRYIAFHFN